MYLTLHNLTYRNLFFFLVQRYYDIFHPTLSEVTDTLSSITSCNKIFV